MPVVTSPFVENTLVSAVPGTLRFEQIHQLPELVLSWGKNKNSRVEYVRPTDVRYRRKFVREGEKVRKRPYRENVRVQEDNLRILRQTENMQLCENMTEIRSTYRYIIKGVLA